MTLLLVSRILFATAFEGVLSWLLLNYNFQLPAWTYTPWIELILPDAFSCFLSLCNNEFGSLILCGLWEVFPLVSFIPDEFLWCLSFVWNDSTDNGIQTHLLLLRTYTLKIVLSQNRRIVQFGGDLKDNLVPTLFMRRAVTHQIRLPRGPSNLNLNTSRFVASTASLSILCQCLTGLKVWIFSSHVCVDPFLMSDERMHVT